MAFTYDTSTSLGKVRNMIGDATDTGHILEDADINSFITIADSDLYRAAALCLYRIAASKALLAKKKTAGNYSEDLTAIAKEVREAAKIYDDMSKSVPAEAQAEVFYTDFNYNEILKNKALRNEST